MRQTLLRSCAELEERGCFPQVVQFVVLELSPIYFSVAEIQGDGCGAVFGGKPPCFSHPVHLLYVQIVKPCKLFPYLVKSHDLRMALNRRLNDY